MIPTQSESLQIRTFPNACLICIYQSRPILLISASIIGSQLHQGFVRLQMGAGQEQPCQLMITVQTNHQLPTQASLQSQLFDFTRPRQQTLHQKVSFPSYVLHYPKHNQIQYSLLQDRLHEVFSIDLGSQLGDEVVITRSGREDKQTVWKVIAENDHYELEEGDRLKLGRMELYLKEVRHINAKKQQRQLPNQGPVEPRERLSMGLGVINPLKNSGYFNHYQYSRMKESDLLSMRMSMLAQSGVSQRSTNERSCRICFDSKTNGANPLFNVCLCAGSVKYVHYQCLKNWFRSKTVRKETPHCIYYSYEPLQCELCKYAISNQVLHQGRKYSLFDYEQIHPPFAKLQHYTDDKVFEILIRLEQSLSIEVGKGPENDLSLNDSSVSRKHCTLYYASQRLVLYPEAARYGTAVQLNRNVELSGSRPLQLLVGSKLVSLSRRGGNGGSCCSMEGQTIVIVQ